MFASYNTGSRTIWPAVATCVVIAMAFLAMPPLADATPIPATQVDLSASYNQPGFYTDGLTFTTGGFDETSTAMSANLLGTSLSWNNLVFDLGPSNTADVVVCTNQIITLPPGQFNTLQILGAAINGGQESQTFTVTYTDNSTNTFTQSISDWADPQSFPGEFTVLTMPYRDGCDGTQDPLTVSVYGYVFVLDQTKTVESITLPNDSDINLMAMLLTPVGPRFGLNPLTLPGVNAGQAYSANIATNASDSTGEPLTFALVSGPAWLTVAANGALSGTPANTDAGTNTFLISATDSDGLSSTNTVYISVTGAPFFILNPFTLPSVVAGRNYSGTMATNATDPNPGDLPVFSIISGPGWLSVNFNGTLHGTPTLANVGINTFTVGVTGYQGNLTSTGTMYILVEAPILSEISPQSGGLSVIWSGGGAPYQLQMTTNLLNPTWQNVGSPISGNNALITPTNGAAFYRVVGQ